VTNLDNGAAVTVRINDRGPYAGGRIIDLSAGAAEAIGMIYSGEAYVALEILN
jgi:rare lipoprotein A